MVFGGVSEERILLTENTFFSGDGFGDNNQSDAAEAYREMDAHCRRGDFAAAEKAAESFMGVRHNYGTSLPVGDLSIRFGGASGEGQASEGSSRSYCRVLDLREGTAVVSCTTGGARLDRHARVSADLNALIYTVRAAEPFSADLDFSPYSNTESSASFSDGFSFTTRALEEMHSDGKTGVLLYGRVKVLTNGTYHPAQKRVEGAEDLTLIVGFTTDFQKDKNSWERGIRLLEDRLSSLDQKILLADLESHKKTMTELFDRSVLNLDLPDKESWESLIPLLYQYGRYLLYSSSRPGSVLPAHLQGVWNDNVACRIGWTCDMHLDINTQMNYWPANLTGLPEVNEPLFRWIKEILVPKGRVSARESYGFAGWSAEIVSNAWGFASPYWAVPITASPGCGIWILTHMYEHFQYTGDLDFLVRDAWPLIQEAVCFALEYLSEDKDGSYITGPGISPENSFTVDGEIRFLSSGTTFDILMVRELFDIYLETLVYLESPEKDAELTARVREAQERLKPYRVLADGTLAEWSHDYPAADSQHRHTSHLLGLYPFAQITPDETPELAAAAAQSIQKKLEFPEKWEDTGWARSMLLLYSARLGEGEECRRHLNDMLTGLLEPNGMIIHPPTRGAPSFDNVYEMDGNTGLTTGVAEMLVQSRRGRIRILPALPAVWQKGSVEGIWARGNIRVSIFWKDGTLEKLILEPAEPVTVVLVYNGVERSVTLDGSCRFDGRLQLLPPVEA